MAGSRSLTPAEQRLLVRRIRRLKARDRALIAAQLFLGFRISEVLALAVGHVWANGRVAPRVALPPRLLKGGYGGTRTVPVGPELRRALEVYLAQRAREGTANPGWPLFLSRQKGRAGGAKPICRSSAEKIVKRTLLKIGGDDQLGLSTHSLRKSWAARLYEASGHDLLCVRDGLGHSSVAVTQVYLPVNRSRIDELIIRSDWTRQRRRRPPSAVPQTVGASIAVNAGGDRAAVAPPVPCIRSG